MESEVVAFFKKLSERHWIENDLSDILWALLSINKEFRRVFFELIKSKNNTKDLSYLTEDILSIEREFYEEEISGRPDLRFEFSSSRRLILEVKVGDKDYHSSYNQLINADIVILTIHNVEKDIQPGWINITWRELHDHIMKVENELIKGFVTFIEGVFAMMDIQKVESFEIKNLVYLNWMVETALSEIENEGPYNVKRNYRTKSFSEDGSGYYFEFILDGKQDLYPWIGINYNVESESKNPFGLMLWLNEYHSIHLDISKKLSTYANLKNDVFPKTEYYCESGKDGVAIMPADWQKSFLCKENKDEQIKCIKDFILECLNKLQYIFDATKMIV